MFLKYFNIPYASKESTNLHNSNAVILLKHPILNIQQFPPNIFNMESLSAHVWFRSCIVIDLSKIGKQGPSSVPEEGREIARKRKESRYPSNEATLHLCI